MIIPPYLKPGDTVGIIAPARRMKKQDLIPAFQLLRDEGFNVFYDKRLFAKEHWFAGHPGHLVRARGLRQRAHHRQIRLQRTLPTSQMALRL